MNHRLIIIPVVFISLLLASCGDSKEKQLKSYVQGIKTRKVNPIEAIPKFVSPAQYAYPSDKERRNPFQSLIMSKVAGSNLNNPDENRLKQPLEAFPLDSLRMVGTLQQDDSIWAIILTPEGTAQRIAVGGYIGRNFGKIVTITKDEVNLQETVREGGDWAKRPASLALVEEQKK